MKKSMKQLPEFESDEEESAFWEEKSPLDYVREPKLERVRTKTPKDMPLTIRLDTGSRKKLEQLAVSYKMGTSTLARLLILGGIGKLSQAPQQALTADELSRNITALLASNEFEELQGFFRDSIVGEPSQPSAIATPFITPTRGEELGRKILALFAKAFGREIKWAEEEVQSGTANKGDEKANSRA